MKRKIFVYKMFSLLMIAVLLISTLNVTWSQAASKPALSAKKMTLTVGKKKKLRVKKVKKKQIKKVRFTSNKKKVAKVNPSSGTVTAVKKGTAKITCKLTLKNNKKYTLKCTVKVKKSQASSDDGENSNSASSTGSPVPANSSTAVVTNPPTGQPGATAGSLNPATVEPNLPGISTASPGTTDSIGNSTSAPQNSANPGASSAPGVSSSQVPSSTTGPTSKPSGVTATPVVPLPKRTKNPADQTQKTPHLSANGISTIDDGKMRSNMTAFDIQHEMGLGINLGNTMESVAPWLDGSSATAYEQAWGAPVTTQEMITGMWEAGFNSIRIPVAWSNMVSKDGNYTINEAYFNRVEEIMNYAFNEGMYVIVNVHYDGGWWGQFGSSDEAIRAKAWDRYEKFWTQIANRYKEYSDYLIFESANEELGERLNDDLDAQGNPYSDQGDPVHGVLTVDECYDTLHQINQKFVDIVRGTGGNNATRHLLLAGYDTNISKTCDEKYEMPTDTIENHMMVSIHYYEPSTYCLVENKDNSWGYMDKWGTDSDVAAMKAELSKMKRAFSDKGIPVIIGEYGGACVKELSDGSMAKKEGRDFFYKTLCEYALNNGMCPVLWDIQFENSIDGIYDRTTCKMIVEAEAQNFLYLAQMADNIEVYEPAAPKDTLVWNGTMEFASWNAVAPVPVGDFDFNITARGGCFQISGIDWSSFSNPVLTLHSGSGTGTYGYSLASSANIDTSNEYYYSIKSAEKKGNWSLSSDLVIDLSTMKLSGREDIFIQIQNGGEFKDTVTLTVSEKQ